MEMESDKTVGEFPVQGKIVLIIGAGSGICFETAKLCHQNGCSVILADIVLSPAASDWIKSIKSTDMKAVFQKTDVSRWDQIQECISVSQDQLGDVPDLYLLGAGIFEPSWSNFWSDPETESYKTIDINTSGIIKATRIAIRALLSKGKKGVIVIIASVAGYTPNFTAPLYVASKFALTGFTRSLAELDALEGIKVVASAPGVVNTPIFTDRAEDYGITNDIAMTPAEFAPSILALAGSAKYPGGSILEVSKGAEWRCVPTFNNPPPAGAGTAPGSMDKPQKRVLEILAKERRASKLGKSC